MRKSVSLWLLAGLAVLFCAPAAAQRYSALLDTDQNAASGCSVVTAAGTVNGVEWRVTATVDGIPQQVVTVERAQCQNGVFAAPIPQVANHPVGLNNGLAGADVIELAVVLAQLSGLRGETRLHFLAESDDGANLVQGMLLALPGYAPFQPPELIPTLQWLGIAILIFAMLLLARRNRALRGAAVVMMLVGMGVVWAANFIADGQVGDWVGESPLLVGPPDNGSNGDASVQIRAVWAATEAGQAFFRFDVLDVENQAPSADALTELTPEDQPLTVTLSGSDPEGSPLTFAIVQAPANGTLGTITPISASTAEVIYTPAADYFGSDSFSYSSNDGQYDSIPALVSITITPVNDAPSFIGQDATIFESGGAQTAIVATAISVGPANEAGQALSFEIVANDNPGLFAAGPSIAADGTLSATPMADQSGVATLGVQLRDDGGTANGGVDVSAPQTIVLTVEGINHAPSFTAGADVAVLEDAAPYDQPWATDLDDGDGGSQALTFVVTSNSNPGLFSTAPAVSGTTGNLSFALTPDASGSAVITLVLQDNGGTANGGVDTSPAQSFTITVDPVNDAPIIDLSGPGVPGTGFAASFIEAGGAVAIVDSAGLSITDIDSTQLQGARVTISNLLDGTDELLAVNVGATGLVATYDSALGELSLSGVATLAIYQQVLRTSTYNNASTDPNQNDRQVEFVVTDAEGAPSAAATSVVSVLAVNTAPSFTAGADVTVLEDAAAYNAAWATNLDDGDGGGQVLTFVVTNNSNPGLFSTAPAVSGSTGNLSFALTPDANGSASITLQLQDNGGTGSGGSDTSAPHVLTINVTAVNDAPSYTLTAPPASLEDAGAQLAIIASNLSAGPPDEAGQSLSFTLVQTGIDPTMSFAAGPSISPTGQLSYTAAPNAWGTASFELSLSDDGGTANGGVDTSPAQVFQISVTPVNDAPSFTAANPPASDEDEGPVAVAGWVTAFDPGPNEAGQGVAEYLVVVTGNPGLFSTAPTVSIAGDLSYASAPDAFGAATIEVRVRDNGGTANGGVDTSAAQSFTITVNPVNDAPVLDLSGPGVPGTGFAASFTEAGGAVAIVDSAALSITDIDSTQLQGARVTISNLLDGTDELLAVNVGATGLVATYDSTLGELSLSGVATLAIYQQVLRTSTYNNASTDPNQNDRLVEFVVTDAEGAPSAAATSVVSVLAVNTAPSFTPGANVTVLEDAAAYNAAWATNLDDGDGGGQVLTFVVTDNSNPGLFSTAPAVSGSTGNLSFALTPDANGSASVTLQLQDNGGTGSGGSDTSAPHVLTINVTAVNDAPSFTIPASAPDIFENDGAQTVAGFATNMSAGPADEAGQVLTFDVSVQSATGNLSFSTAPAIDPVSGNLTYAPAADASGVATINVTLSDNGGTANGGIDTSPMQSFTISVLFVNSAPTFTAGGDVDVLEDSGAYNQPWASAMDDGDPTQTQDLSFIVQGNTNPGLFAVAPAIDASTGNLSFTPAADAFGSATLTVALRDDGGTANGGSDTSAPVDFVINLGPVNDPPSFNVPASAPASLEDAGAQSVADFATNLSTGPANESGQTLLGFSLVIDSADPSLTFSAPPAIALDGTLTYTAAPDAFGTATITATLQDDGGTANGGNDSFSRSFTIVVTGINDAPSFIPGANVVVNEDSGAFNAAWATAISAGPNEAGQVLTFNITGNTAPGLFSVQPAINPATGNLTFSTFQDANGTATLTVTLSDNGGIANGGVDTSAPVDFTITLTPVNDPPVVVPPTNVAANRHIGIVIPTANASNLLANVTDVDGPGAAPFSVTVVTDAATVQGGRVTTNADGSWSYQPPASNVLASDSFNYTVCDSGVPMPPACTVATATVALSGNAVWFVNPAAAAGGDGTLARPFQTIGQAATAAGVDGLIFAFSGNHSGGHTLSNGQRLIGQGVSVASATSFDAVFGLTPPATSVARPSIGGSHPVITTVGGSVNGIVLGNGNTVRGIEIGDTSGVGLFGAAVGTLTLGDNRILGAGQAMSLTGGTIVQAPSATAFSSVTSSSGVNNIALSGIAGTADFGGGALSGASGTAFQFSTGSATINYTGTITKVSPGRLIDIDGAGAATITLSGNLSCITTCGTDPGNAGIRINARTGGTYTFSGATKTISSSGANPGVSLSNTGGTFVFSNGGLAITTSSGAAFTATGGGTVTVTPGANPNTLVSTTGSALNVVNTAVGAGGLTFRSINVTGNGAAPSNGILLSNTGSAGGLTVTGTGVADSGGVIQNTAARGASFISAANVRLNWMRFQNATNSNGADPTNAASTCGDLSVGGNLGCNAPIHLASVAQIGGTPAVILDRIVINSSAQVGVNINNVTGLTFSNSSITGAGNEVREYGLKGRNLLGTVVLNNLSITGSFGENFRVENNTGTTAVTVTGSTFNNATQGGGFFHIGQGSAQTAVDISTSTFSGNFSTGTIVGFSDPGAASTASAAMDVLGGTFSNNNAGIQMIGAGAADHSFTVLNVAALSGNPAAGFALDLSDTSTAAASMIGTVSGNTITMPAAGAGNGINASARGAGLTTVSASSNTVTNRTQHGIHLHRKEGIGGTMNATVSNNNVTTIDLPFPADLLYPADGIRVEAGAAGADTGTVCAHVTGNTATGANSVPAEAPGDDIRLRHRFAHTFRLPGLIGSTGGDADSHKTALNPGATLVGATTTTAFSGGAAPCPVP
jgi:large repetitive protein